MWVTKKVVYDTEEQLHLKKKKIDNYKYELSSKLSNYHYHYIVKSFLWIQLNKKRTIHT